MTRTKQCKACPWKKATNPHKDISGGYDPKKHAALVSCQSSGLYDPGRTMACHESSPGADEACVGWLANQLGPGNNLALRMRAIIGGEFRDLRTFGEQHESLDAMIATSQRGKRT
jgi:hypothetical protein